VLELGTFTGYGAMAMAEALPADGEIITCDLDPVATKIAQKYWARSPHGSKIRLRLGPALKTLETIHPPLDLVFLDADKENYIQYWEACIPKLRGGGVLAADNVLWSGRVLAPKEPDDHAIVAFNKHVAGDDRVETVIIPIRDGVSVSIKL
jgi:caffeoyl-CoA O-methyltransferase